MFRVSFFNFDFLFPKCEGYMPCLLHSASSYADRCAGHVARMWDMAVHTVF
jgi:hypothetical protein